MHSRSPTIRVKATDPEQGEFVTINAADFDPDKHERFDDEVMDAPPAPPVALADLPPPPPAPAPEAPPAPPAE